MKLREMKWKHKIMNTKMGTRIIIIPVYPVRPFIPVVIAQVFSLKIKDYVILVFYPSLKFQNQSITSIMFLRDTASFPLSLPDIFKVVAFLFSAVSVRNRHGEVYFNFKF